MHFQKISDCFGKNKSIELSKVQLKKKISDLLIPEIVL